jgi:hypothetical protein
MLIRCLAGATESVGGICNHRGHGTWRAGKQRLLDRRASGVPVGGPFDLWRPNYFHANGEPPDDTAKMYPSLSAQTVTDLAVATVRGGATLDDVLSAFADRGPRLELTVAHRYFSQWRRRAPFMPDSMQDLPQRPARTSPEPLEEFLEDWRRHHPQA